MVLKYVSIIDKVTGKCVATDIERQGMEQKDVTKNIFDNYWYLTGALESNQEYQTKLLALRKKEKYQEITEAYDKACNYGTCKAVLTLNDREESYYCNRAWLGTWQEAITGLEYTKGTAFVRLYEKYGDFHFKNITLENITVDQYKALYLQLINFRFNTIQPIRNSLYSALEQCQNVKDVDNLKVDFKTICVDEQNDINNVIILNEPERDK